MCDLWISTGFVAHHEKEGGGVGDRMGGGVVREFCHGEFGPFSGLIFGEDPKVCFKLLVDPFQFTVSLVGGREGYVIF